MKYLEVFEKSNIVRHIHLSVNGKKLQATTCASIMLMRVQYDKIIAEFEKDMQDVVKGLKSDGFDERAQEIARMKEIDAKKDATTQEKEEADKTRETQADYDKELAELEEAYSDARQKKLDEEVKFTERKLSDKELADVIDVLGVEGIMTVNEREIANELFLSIVAASLV